MTPLQSAREWVAEASLEELLTSRHFFGLETASPLQRAICRLADGRPLGALADRDDVRRAMGDVSGLGIVSELTVCSGIRVAKSFLAGALAVRLSQRVQIPGWVKPGEVPRIPLLSLDKDKALPILNHLVGGIQSSPILRSVLVGVDGECVTLRHPSGRHVEVMVTAGKRAGGAVVARWLFGCVFDEFPRMQGADDAVVNWDETRRGAMNRILPGGLILNIGSPWAPHGPAFDQVTQNHARWSTLAKPSSALAVVWAPAWEMNPVYWTPERCEAERVRDPNAYQTDVAAEFATAPEAFFSAEQIDAAIRTEPQGALPRDPRASYAAFIDPASRTNAFTFLIVTRDGDTMRVALAREWTGTRDKPLDTGAVCTEMAADLATYGLTFVESDGYMGDALASQARERGFDIVLRLTPTAERMKQALHFRTKLGAGEIELSLVQATRAGMPFIANTMALDMKRVRRKVTQTSAVVDLPQTSDGRHCDWAPPLLSAMRDYLTDRAPETVELDPEVQRMQEEAQRRFAPRREDDD